MKNDYHLQKDYDQGSHYSRDEHDGMPRNTSGSINRFNSGCVMAFLCFFMPLLFLIIVIARTDVDFFRDT